LVEASTANLPPLLTDESYDPTSIGSFPPVDDCVDVLIQQLAFGNLNVYCKPVVSVVGTGRGINRLGVGMADLSLRSKRLRCGAALPAPVIDA
jgi:hypothetical protein